MFAASPHLANAQVRLCLAKHIRQVYTQLNSTLLRLHHGTPSWLTKQQKNSRVGHKIVVVYLGRSKNMKHVFEEYTKLENWRERF